MFPQELHGCLWHSTSVERMNGIFEAGVIFPEPDIPDCKRWGTGLGEDHYPYVRHLGGISLFDFHEFDNEKYAKKYPVSCISSFVPNCHKYDKTAWIEIDRRKVQESFISGDNLLKKWKQDEKQGHNIMPLIECAYIGELSTNCFSQVLIYESQTKSFTKA